MRKIISILLCIVLLITFIPGMALAESSTLGISETTLGIGESITVKYIVPNAVDGVMAAEVHINFDKTKFEVTSVDRLAIGGTASIGNTVNEANSNGYVSYVWSDQVPRNIIAATEIMTVTLEAIGAGSSNISISDIILTGGAYGMEDFSSTAGAVNASKNVTVTLPPSTIVINTYAGKTYDGAAVTDPTDVTVTGSDGEVTFKYYSDENCNSEISAPAKAGTYWVKATVAANATHAAATSAAKSFTIEKADYTYAGPTESTDKTVGNQYPAGGYAYAAGVNSETVRR